MPILVKQPAEALRHPLAAPGPVAEVVSIGAIGRGLVVGAAALGAVGELAAGAMTLILSGGSDGERYLVTTTLRLADGEVRELEIEVAVIDAAWAMPDGGAPMLSIAGFVERFGLEEAVRMTDDGSGRIDRAMLVGALRAAQAFAELHLGSRYTLPLAVVPDVIADAIADIARARLYPGEAPKGVEANARRAERTLEQIGSGKLPLPGAAAQPSGEPTANPILISPGERLYGRGPGLADY